MSASWKGKNCILAALYLGVVLWAVGPVMRESDQASLLSGSVELARDGQLIGRADYNYSRQFGSYWLLSPAFKLAGLDQVGAEPAQVVKFGNLLAALVFLIGLFALLWKRGPESWWDWGVVGAVLLCPVIFFSAPLLSSNLISAGFLCQLVLLITGEKNLVRDVGCGLFGFAAVAARADAVLVLPLVSLLSVRKLGWRELFGERRLWFLAIGSVLALIVGTLVSVQVTARYSAFFQPMVATSYIVFGLGGAFLVLTGMSFWLLRKGGRNPDWHGVWVAIAMFVPLAFYGRVLFSPRHLMTTALVVLFFVCFEKGREWLLEMRAGRGGKVFLAIVISTTWVPMVVGVRLTSMKSGGLANSSPTLYPTADGYWPMGCYGQFFSWLRDAAAKPIDHNQRVWEAWTRVESLPESFSFRSSGLTSFGLLQATLLDEKDQILRESPSFIVDGRSVSKRVVHVGGGAVMDRFEQDDLVGELLATGGGEEIYLSSSSGEFLGEKAAVRLLLREFGGGDDYIILERDADWTELKGSGPFRWFFFSDINVGLGAGGVRELVGGESFYLKAGSDERWIARSALASFFRVNSYEN